MATPAMMRRYRTSRRVQTPSSATAASELIGATDPVCSSRAWSWAEWSVIAPRKLLHDPDLAGRLRL